MLKVSIFLSIVIDKTGLDQPPEWNKIACSLYNIPNELKIWSAKKKAKKLNKTKQKTR